MEATNLRDLVGYLSGPTLIVRTGLWLASPRIIGYENDHAARLGIDARDLRLPIKSSLPPGTRYLGLTTDFLVQALDTICHQSDGSNCVLIYNLDLLLARLHRHERMDFWQFVFVGFPHRPRGVLLVLPTCADQLLPSNQIQDAWRQDGRLIADPVIR